MKEGVVDEEDTGGDLEGVVVGAGAAAKVVMDVEVAGEDGVMARMAVGWAVGDWTMKHLRSRQTTSG